ncbi:glutathione S-transferase [Rhypophila decipiens]|uniref:Glutathione S-transferase n=1 Tax=Rhypophila decipiens TaxID=261697 RepID=A0AAN6YJM5_9PEZI|nr:glutathione S-transferase [Rhypophila decipiens]
MRSSRQTLLTTWFLLTKTSRPSFTPIKKPFSHRNQTRTMASVDSSNKGQATGLAAKYAERHSGEHPLKLYGAWFCPFVQRSWIVLAEKKTPHQYIEINPYHKAPQFLALNPRGLVPTLAVPSVGKGGKATKPLYESTVVCEYLDEAFTDEDKHGPRLLPLDDVYERARCRLWIDHIGSRIVPSFYRFIQHTPEKEYSIEGVRTEFLGHLRALVKEMDPDEGEDGGPFFLGSQFSLVDVMLAPWAKRLFLIDHYKPGGVGIPAAGEGGDDEWVWSRWRKWQDAIFERDSVKKTWSDDDQYIEVYKRYAEDKTGSEVGKATRQGRSLP